MSAEYRYIINWKSNKASLEKKFNVNLSRYKMSTLWFQLKCKDDSTAKCLLNSKALGPAHLPPHNMPPRHYLLPGLPQQHSLLLLPLQCHACASQQLFWEVITLLKGSIPLIYKVSWFTINTVSNFCFLFLMECNYDHNLYYSWNGNYHNLSIIGYIIIICI